MSFNDYDAALTGARRALDDHRYADALSSATRLLAVTPHHWFVELLYARASVGVGREADALTAYTALIDQGYGRVVADDPTFVSLAQRAGRTDLRERAGAQLAGVGSARVAFRLNDPHTIPEGLAYDSKSERFFASATYMRNVVVRDRSGNWTDFVAPKDNGLLQAVGVRVDRAGRALLVCTSADDRRLLDGQDSDRGRSGIFIYDLATARLISKSWIQDGGFHLFNDLVETSSGHIYITDSRDGRVFRFDRKSQTFSGLTERDAFLYPNGITIDPSDRYLFVADLAGITLIDTRTGDRRRLEEAPAVSAAEIDGLYYFRGALIGVQDGFGVDRVVAFYLDRSLRSIASSRVLLEGGKHTRQLTEGVVVGENFYVVAESQQTAFDADDKLIEGGLHPSVVLELRLDAATHGSD